MDGVMHPSVEQAIGRDRIRNALKRYENNPADEHDRGIVRAVNADGSYEVLLDGDVQTARCAPYAKAMVGDRVIVVTTKDGENVLLGRLGGETEIIAPTIEERFEKLEVDYIVAEGKSGSSYYRKWASGKAECWRRTDFSDMSITSAYGNGYYTNRGAYVFPFKFVDVPHGYVTVWSGTGLLWSSFSELTATQYKLYICSASSITGINPTVMTYVYGFWK